MNSRITIIGGGLAGSEAALQAAERGVGVDLYEMRPQTQTPAHQTGLLAELVCSNSLKSKQVTAAHGLLKEELRVLGSRLLALAEANAVPAGQSLAVDRERFSSAVTSAIEAHPNVVVHRQEARELPLEGVAVLCAGPLVSPMLAESLAGLLGEEHLFFYDAVAPIVEEESLDRELVFPASRYDKGEPDFLNCPMDQEEYLSFWHELTKAEQHPLHDFEDGHYFEGCLAVEEMARRGEKCLAFGPLKPVGLNDPRTGKRPHAVVQLRRENEQGNMWNLVGFQTRLSEKEQQRVFRMIPGLRGARFLRYGKMHRNTYLCAPKALDSALRLKGRQSIFVAGQLTGSEGYTEAIATGLLCGINAARAVQGKDPSLPPEVSGLGSLVRHLTSAPAEGFQPMNFNFGLLPELETRIRGKRDRRASLAQRSLDSMKAWVPKGL